MRCGLIAIVAGALALLLVTPAAAGEPISTDDLIELPAPALRGRLLAEFDEALEVRSDLPALSGDGSASRVFLVTRPRVVVTPTVCVVDVVRPAFDPPLVYEDGLEGATPRRIVGLIVYSLYRVDPVDPLGRGQADCRSLDVSSDHFFVADDELVAALGYAALESTIRDALAGPFEVVCPLERDLPPLECRRALGSVELRKLKSITLCETASLDLMCADLEVGDWRLRLYGVFQGKTFGAAQVSLRRSAPVADP